MLLLPPIPVKFSTVDQWLIVSLGILGQLWLVPPLFIAGSGATSYSGCCIVIYFWNIHSALLGSTGCRRINCSCESHWYLPANILFDIAGCDRLNAVLDCVILEFLVISLQADCLHSVTEFCRLIFDLNLTLR